MHLAAARCRRAASCLARTLPTTTGIDRLQMDGLGGSDRWTVWPSISTVGREAEVVLDVARAPHVVGLEALALELARTARCRACSTMLTSVLSRPRCGMPITTSLTPSRPPRFDDRSKRGDQRLAAFEPEALGADVVSLAERLEPLGLGQLLQDHAVAPRREGGRFTMCLDALAGSTTSGRDPGCA